jgi:5'-3' exonuclease
LEEVLEHADDLTPARRKAVQEHADQARAAKQLATMRRDLELDTEPCLVRLVEPDIGWLRGVAVEAGEGLHAESLLQGGRI